LFPYRLASIDLDDTLLGPDKIISAQNAAAVQALRERGIHVTLASGRRHENMLQFHEQLGLRGPIVSCNGACVKDAETGEVFAQTLVPADLAEEVVEAGDRLGVTQNYYHTDGGLYVREKTGWSDLYQRRTGSDVTETGDLEQFGGGHALKILWIDAPERIATLYADLSARYAGRLYVTITDPEYLEFMAPGVSKAEGLKVVADRLGIRREEAIAFGDGNNDAPMLEWARLGVAMDHGRDSAKAVADLVPPPGDPETGLARAVEAVFARVDAS
jgi:hypothetical protein